MFKEYNALCKRAEDSLKAKMTMDFFVTTSSKRKPTMMAAEREIAGGHDGICIHLLSPRNAPNQRKIAVGRYFMYGDTSGTSSPRPGVAGGVAPNRVRTLTPFTPKYTYYLEYFSFFKREKNYLEKRDYVRDRWMRTRWVRTRLGAKPSSLRPGHDPFYHHGNQHPKVRKKKVR